MADLGKIRRVIAEIGGRQNSVTPEEIARVISTLEACGISTNSRPVRHGRLYRVGHLRFQVCEHNRHSRFVKACYVRAFLDAMCELGFYEG